MRGSHRGPPTGRPRPTAPKDKAPEGRRGPGTAPAAKPQVDLARPGARAQREGRRTKRRRRAGERLAKKTSPGGRLDPPPGDVDTEMPLVGQRRPALPRTDSAVPSALGGLTSGFGMGPGVPPPPWSLTNEGHSAVRGGPGGRALGAAQRATGALVAPSVRGRAAIVRQSMKGRARAISDARLSASPRLHLRPIDLVVYEGPYRREDSSRDWLPA